MNIIEKGFSPLCGKPCWGVVYDSHTNLAMNFGDPYLVIREPYSTESKLKRVQEQASRRQVHVRGQWWLWIFYASWRVYRKGQLLGGYSSSFRKGSIAAHFLDGQKLIAVKTNAKTGETRFEFDLEGVLEVSRFKKDDDSSDLWLLYKPNGYVLSVHGDGTYDHAPGSGIDKRKGVTKQPL